MENCSALLAFLNYLRSLKIIASNKNKVRICLLKKIFLINIFHMKDANSLNYDGSSYNSHFYC